MPAERSRVANRATRPGGAVGRCRRRAGGVEEEALALYVVHSRAGSLGFVVYIRRARDEGTMFYRVIFIGNSEKMSTGVKKKNRWLTKSVPSSIVRALSKRGPP